MIKWSKNTKAQSTVEFSLLLPILIFFFFALISVGYWMIAQQVVTQAAREAAKQGSLTNDNSQIGGAVVAKMAALDPNRTRTTVGITPQQNDDPLRKKGNPLTVQVTFQMPFSFSFLPETFLRVTSRFTTTIECSPPAGQFTCG